MKFLRMVAFLAAASVSSVASADILPLLYSVNIHNASQANVGGIWQHEPTASDPVDSSSSEGAVNGLVPSGSWSSSIEMTGGTRISGYSFVDASAGDGQVTVNFNSLYETAAGGRGWSQHSLNLQAYVGIWAPVGDSVRVTFEGDTSGEGFKQSSCSGSIPCGLSSFDVTQTAGGQTFSPSRNVNGVEYGQVFTMGTVQRSIVRASTQYIAGPSHNGSTRTLGGSVTFTAENLSREEPCEAALLFRERGSGVPGWDHVGLEYCDKVYEAHPDPQLGQGPGVQDGHTPETFFSDGDETKRIPIREDLAEKMVDFIESQLGAPFVDPPGGVLDTLKFIEPFNQKGGLGGYTCAGLIERAAEEAGHNFGQGFIPDVLESIRVPSPPGSIIPPGIGTLSPEMLAWAAELNLTASDLKNYVQGFFDPVDFMLTDPLGRRLGYTEASGEINEIPDALYTGDDIYEQFVILDPVAGEYSLTLFGLVDEDIIAAIGDRLGGNAVVANLSTGGTTTFTYVVVPEPSSVIGLMVCCFVGILTSRIRITCPQ